MPIEERLAFTYPLPTEIDGIAQHVPGIGGFKTIAEKRGGLTVISVCPRAASDRPNGTAVPIHALGVAVRLS